MGALTESALRTLFMRTTARRHACRAKFRTPMEILQSPVTRATSCRPSGAGPPERRQGCCSRQQSFAPTSAFRQARPSGARRRRDSRGPASRAACDFAASVVEALSPPVGGRRRGSHRLGVGGVPRRSAAACPDVGFVELFARLRRYDRSRPRRRLPLEPDSPGSGDRVG